MRVLVTGASGHLGAALVREALADGHTVRGLARSTSDTTAVDGLDFELVRGDILEPLTLTPAMQDIDWVLHAAAVYRNWAPDPVDIIDPAVAGTENVLRAAAEAGVARVVVTSSIATVGYGPNRAVLDESHSMESPKSIYIQAKCEQEARALDLEKDLPLDVIIVNPGGNMGPWDIKLTPTSRALVALAGGDPVVLDLAVTHIADIARGHLLAAEKGESGRRYLLTGENLTREDAAALMSELTGRKVKAILPPRFVMRLIAWNEVRKAKKTGADAAITGNQVVDVYGKSLFYDSSRAMEELGWTARPGREVLLDSLAWLAARGELTDAVAEHVLSLRPADASWPTS